jgi:hypothetical protein
MLSSLPLTYLLKKPAVLAPSHHLVSRWGHPQRAIEADDLAIDHGVLNDALHKLRVLIRVSQPGGKGYHRPELILHLLRQPRQHGRPEEACTTPHEENTHRLNTGEKEHCQKVYKLVTDPRLARLYGEGSCVTSPGAMATFLMPSLARSRARGSVIPTTAPLDAAYATWQVGHRRSAAPSRRGPRERIKSRLTCPICPSYAAILAVLTITPRCPCSPAGSLDILRRGPRTQGWINNGDGVACGIEALPFGREADDVESPPHIHLQHLPEAAVFP